MKVITNKVRMSYLNWSAPREGLDGKLSYSVELLIPKSDTETVTKIKAAMKAALEKKFGAKFPAGLKNPLQDGDTKLKADGSPLGEEYKGHFFVRAKSTDQPGVVDLQGRPISDVMQFGSGDFGRASIAAYAYDTPMNKGVAFGLNNLQFLERGPSLGGAKSTANEDFGVVNSAASDFETPVIQQQDGDIPF